MLRRTLGLASLLFAFFALPFAAGHPSASPPTMSAAVVHLPPHVVSIDNAKRAFLPAVAGAQAVTAVDTSQPAESASTTVVRDERRSHVGAIVGGVVGAAIIGGLLYLARSNNDSSDGQSRGSGGSSSARFAS
jgi:hypothetical protein